MPLSRTRRPTNELGGSEYPPVEGALDSFYDRLPELVGRALEEGSLRGCTGRAGGVRLPYLLLFS